jgi:subtilisin-like proprotein convertase family protein
MFLAVVGSAQAAKSITLAWDPSPDSTVSGYNIYYGAASAQYTNHVFVSGASTTTTTIGNLEDGVTYYFAATSRGSTGEESTFSNEVNYQPAPVVTPVAPSITWSQPAAISYGTALSAAQLNATASVAGTFTYNPALNRVLPAGNGQTLTAVFTPADTTKYTSVTTTVLLNVAKVPLTISANSRTKTYGAANPTLTATYTGFVNGDTAASLTTPVTLATTATAGSPAGTYAITASGAASSNYTIVYANGSLNVTPAALTITADSKSKAYGTANPTLTAAYTGFVNGDTAASLTTPVSLATTATATSPLGSYPITASGATSPNYTITFVNGSLNVTSAVLTITADAKTKTYGSALPTLTATYSGFINGDTAAKLTTLPSLTTTATAGSPAGTYAITASGAASSNYTIVYANGSLNVTPAALTITADSKSKAYGAANPTLTATYTGFVNGDSAASLTTPVTLATTATATSPLGSYPITASGATSPNYTITFVNGSLNVASAVLTITADTKTKTYGSALPTLTATYSGFINGDTAAKLTTLPSLTTTATAGSPAGTYTITASGAVSSNYTIVYANGSLNVTPAALTITADSKSKAYGAANPALTATYTGFVNGDTAASLATPVSLATTANVTSHVGVYPINATGAASPNYTISFVNNNLNVTPAALTITANNQSRTANTANPTFTASFAGFVNGETAATLTTPVSLTTTATTSSPAGTYPIVASGAQDADYTITHVNGTLTVTAEVVAASLVSLEVTPSTASVTVGQTAQFNATGKYSDGSVSNLTATASWLSSATSIASVTGTGLATGLTAGNATITASWSGISSSATLTVKSNTASGSVTLVSTRAMTIPSVGVASPYSTTINAAGLSGVISKVTVTLNNVTHSWPHDINVMLAGPAGQKALLMRHVGGGYSISDMDITLDDDTQAKMDNYRALKAGVYKPTNYGTVYRFASPAPATPYPTKLSAFDGTNPNGTWSLYVMDDSSGDSGSIGGWSLTITTTTATLLDFARPDVEPQLEADLLAVKPAIATPPAAWIESISFNTNGQAALIMSGRPDAQYTVESTTDFVQWATVETGVVPVGQFTVTDPQSGTNSGRFYRVVAQ